MQLTDGRRVGFARIIEHLEDDATRNLFALYDLSREPSNTSIFLAIEGNEIKGYLLVYKGLSYRTAIIRGSGPATDLLLDKIMGQKMVLFLDPPALAMARERLGVTAVIPEDLMAVKRDDAKFPSQKLAKRLDAEDAENILDLYPNLPHTRENRERYAKWTELHVVYGVYRDGLLVSVAGTWAETDEGWIVGGVYTSPTHRKTGYGTMATSAVTERALRTARQSTLFVVSTNTPAIRVYENLGYRKVAERLWVDIGTGMKPLIGKY